MRAVCGVLAAAAILASSAAASELSDDLRARRGRVMERLGPDTMLILWSAPVQRYSLDIDYEYRQDSNLYYLTGLTQEGIERVQPAVRRYADIGVRIEDSYLVEDQGIVNLSAAVPKTIEAVEAFLRTKYTNRTQP